MVEAGGALGTSGEPATVLEERDPPAVGHLEQDQDLEVDEAEPAPLVLHRHRPRAPLPPAVQQLFDKQDALTAQLLMQDADPAHQPLLTRLENIRLLLLESGPFLGDLELESLQGEVEAMAVYAAYAQEDRDTELDRRLSASLQEEFDQEMAEQLERDNGWPAATEQDQLVECCICLEEVATKDCIAPCVAADDTTAMEDGGNGEEAAGPDSPAPGLPPGTCSHWHCIDCLRQYATVKVMDDRTPRIPCTRASEGCPAVFPFENVEWLLGDKETQVYLQLLAEASITTKVYCPFDGCTAVMDCAEDERGPDSICASCKRVFCRECRVAWHADQTCAQFQSAKEDEPLHVLAKKKHWKPCPKCHNMIERKNGCNFMRCKCGAGFCYKCGAAYLDITGSTTNAHGTPGCKCGLFM
ncbi:Zinc finger domain containing protein [Klebsormidium nitens]|uniref:RBR-type E3 ubiquitin transferase n=1 Tax=Klebsormidium nitens TaxID=105231 RepID=A0A1Y1IH27_KLENI|nr:Zinc finger domain containing protein [Klebsormidium nitens]|eukprot:GAQ90170.1 Zinc finger domain containing protein [Klebsormidium nitens]